MRAESGGVHFRAASAASTATDTRNALQECVDLVSGATQALPDFVTIHYGAGRPADEVWRFVQGAFPSVAVHGGSFCLGVMTERGAKISDGAAIGVFAIWDPSGSYGTGSAVLGDQPRAAARTATRAALSCAGRPGEAPEIVWLTAAPGQEEAVLLGIKDVVGSTALIVGGSSADNDVSGAWSQLAIEGPARDAVVVSVLFPSVGFGYAFESGYAPTGTSGRVTRAHGRTVMAIDGRPAAQLYSEWTGGRVAVPEAGRSSILAPATMFPLGRRHGGIDGIPFHLLMHPAVAYPDGRLEFFADVAEGTELWLMTGTEDSLVQRAGRIAESSRSAIGSGTPSGALMIYCGGCMLSVRARMDEVAGNVAEALDGAPFLGVFSFGEQGETITGSSEHGNLMISCVTFGRVQDESDLRGRGMRP